MFVFVIVFSVLLYYCDLFGCFLLLNFIWQLRSFFKKLEHSQSNINFVELFQGQELSCLIQHILHPRFLLGATRADRLGAKLQYLGI